MIDDDLSWYMDDPAEACEEHRLLQELRGALLGPASTSELAGSELLRQMYRREQARTDPRARRTAIESARRRSRFSPLLPAGTALTVCLLLPTGTAVAAYTGRLPSPVQGWAHTALGRVGVPASKHPAIPRGDHIVRTPDVDRPGPRHRDSHPLLRRRSGQPCPIMLPRQPATRHTFLPAPTLISEEGGRSACGHVATSPRHDGAFKPTRTALPGHTIGVRVTPGPGSPPRGTSRTHAPAVPIQVSPRHK